MISLVIENVITDLRKLNVSIPEEVFDALNEFINFQESYAKKLDITKWQDVKDKTVLLSDGSEVIAIYDKNKFIYNPEKIKISAAPDYDIYEIISGGVSVQNRREQRRDDLAGLIATKDSTFAGTPKSTTYIWQKDWDPEVNKVYYTKLLARRHLKLYAQQLANAYDVVKKMIDQRMQRLPGKQAEYDRMINAIVAQILKVQELLGTAELNVAFDPELIKKEIAKLKFQNLNNSDFVLKKQDDELSEEQILEILEQ